MVDLFSVALGSPHVHMRVEGAATSAQAFNTFRDIAKPPADGFLLSVDDDAPLQSRPLP